MMYYILHRDGITSEAAKYKKVRKQYNGTAMVGGISERMARSISIRIQ